MTNKPEQGPSAFELLSKFTRLRESGTNRDDAWYQVCDAAGEIPEVTLKAFLNLAKNWERREGHKYHYRNNGISRDSTLTRKPEGLGERLAAAQQQTVQVEQPAPPVIQPLPSQRSNGAALTGTLDASRLREYEQKRLDQILDQLDDEDGEPPAPPAQSEQRPPSNPAPKTRTAPIGVARDHFGPHTALLMYFKNHPTPLRIAVAGESELFIGRATANAAMSPEIDLNVVNAGSFGVSRMHAAITRRNNQLLICDLESMNFTFINGMRLLPNEVRVLQDGDEVWFGQLRCQIRFQHQPAPTS